MDYSSLTVKKLQQLCKERGLPTKGNKKDLIEVLEQLQKPAIELLAESLPLSEIDDVEIAEDEEVVEEEPEPAPAPAPAPIEENVTINEAVPVETAPEASEVAPALAQRASSRVRRPRICTMCPGTHYHPTHAAGSVNRRAKAAPAVVDDASIGELAEKLAAVNIVPRQPKQQAKDEIEPAKPSVKVSTKSRTATVKVRAPLRAKPNQLTTEKVDPQPVQKDVKADVKSKSKVSGKTKVASVKGISAALAAESGKENVVSAGTEAVKAPTERVFERRGRSGKSVAAA